MKISVVIAAYNASATIERAVRSVLAQRRRADEILVIDDGSTDGTADIVRRFGSEVRLISQANGGASAARNRGIEAAGGEWIAFLDADDEWLPEKLEYQCRFLSHQPDIAWCYCDLILDNPAVKQRKSAHPIRDFIPKETRDGIVFDDYLTAYPQGFFVSTITVIIRRDVLKQTGGFVAGMKRAQDNDLWLRIAYQYPEIGYIPQALAIYHLDTVGSSTKVNIHYEFMIRLVERHLELSAQYGRREAFLPCIRSMLEVWIRELVRDGHGQEARDLMSRFGTYLSPRFAREIQFRLRFPYGGSFMADLFLRCKEKIFNR